MVRRLVSVLMLVVLPLQVGWNAALNVHGHAHGDASPVFHAHDHDSRGALGDPGDSITGGEPRSDGTLVKPVEALAGIGDAGTPDGDPAEGHYHPIFASLVSHIALIPEAMPAARAPAHPPDTFSSRTPPPFDWPPSRRA
jgi:hypothetical protein